jgi:hypothetical protein
MKLIEMELALRGAGIVLLGLVLANFIAAKRLRYAENLSGSGPLVRQIFHVHCAYIVGIIAALALLCLGWPGLLLEGPLGKVLCGFFGLFWGSRVVVQLVYYDREARRRDRAWDLFFLAVFCGLSVVFTLATLFQ